MLDMKFGNKLFIFLVFLFLVVSIITFNSSASLMPPPGVWGIVDVDTVPTGGLLVHVENLNNGEYDDQLTAYENPPFSMAGGYAMCIPAHNGDIIEISCVYDGSTYTNTTIVNLDLFDQALYLSIDTGNPPPPLPPSPPPPPPPPPPDEPPEEPEPEDPPYVPPEELEPSENESEETDWYNITISVTENKTTKPVYNASVTIYDTNKTVKITENNTDESGNVTFYLEAGNYTIVATKEGYQMAGTEITFSGSSVYNLALDADDIQEENNDIIEQSPLNQNNQDIYIFIVIGSILTIVGISIVIYRKKQIAKQKDR